MKTRSLAALVVSLIGFHSIYSALLVVTTPIMLLVLSLFTDEHRPEVIGFTTLMTISHAVLPLGFGLWMVLKADPIAGWITRRIGAAEPAVAIALDDLGSLLFAALGLYILAEAIPDALRVVAAWFQARAAEYSPSSGISTRDFWRQQFPTLVYHAACVGFGLFVFLRGKHIHQSVQSLRSAVRRSPRA